MTLRRQPVLLVQGLALLVFVLISGLPAQAADNVTDGFVRVPVEYIAALGEPDETSGSGAETWGHWPVDPGPRGVRLSNYTKLRQAGGVAPAKWQFDSEDWWLEENGLIMEKPDFPLPPGEYVVTGGRDKIAILTVQQPDSEGISRWSLNNGATLHDVTHLGCRSARYTPMNDGEICSPANAPQSVFRIEPGREMPHVAGCNKQDYAVLFLIGKKAEN
ncbi:MAG: hypothetical protein RIM72_15805 [Alphaproteobacteria bacterium]